MEDLAKKKISIEGDLREILDQRRASVSAESYNPEVERLENVPIFEKSNEQKNMLAKAIEKLMLFKSLDEEQVKEIILAMEEKTVKANDVVIKQGEGGDSFYVIQHGNFESFSISPLGIKTSVCLYQNEGYFGELALMYNVPRTTSVLALTDGKLWSLDRGTFRKIVVTSSWKKRTMYEEFISSVPFLKELKPTEKQKLADSLESKSYVDGETIVAKGVASEGMFFVEAGEVVLKDEEEGPIINRLGHGEFFGELALINHDHRPYNAFAVGNVRIAFLTIAAFERLLGPCIEIMKRNLESYQLPN